MLNGRNNQSFSAFQNKGFAAIEPEPARFSLESDSRRSSRVAVHAATRQIELVWRDVRGVEQITGWPMHRGGHNVELAAVLRPCAAATVSIDGAALDGEVRLTARDGLPQSTASLAPAGPWIEKPYAVS